MSARKLSKKDKLLLSMLGTFDDLGRSHMARIDARAWFHHYHRKIKRLGLVESDKNR